MTTTLKTAIETYLAEINAEQGEIDEVHLRQLPRDNANPLRRRQEGRQDFAGAHGWLLQERGGYDDEVERRDEAESDGDGSTNKTHSPPVPRMGVDQKLLDKLPLPKERAKCKPKSRRKENAPNEPKVKKEKKATPSKWVAGPDKPKVEEVGVEKEWVMEAKKKDQRIPEPAHPRHRPTQTKVRRTVRVGSAHEADRSETIS
jgi:hypothetical protein